MCKVCSGEATIEVDDMTIEIDGDVMEVNYNPIFTDGNSATERFKANYCFICGEKLTK